MEPTCIVNPLSALDIELDSSVFLKEYQPRVLEGKEPLDVTKLLDDIFLDKGFSLQLITDDELPQTILGVAEMDNKIIKIRESDYLKCDSEGYQRMTVTHEVGHSRLHFPQFEKEGMKMCRTQSNYIPPYMSSEWQARVWASATLMPLPAIAKIVLDTYYKSSSELIEAIVKKFIVSASAAEARLSTLKRYQEDGRYQKIKDAMNKKEIMQTQCIIL